MDENILTKAGRADSRAVVANHEPIRDYARAASHLGKDLIGSIAKFDFTGFLSEAPRPSTFNRTRPHRRASRPDILN